MRTVGKVVIGGVAVGLATVVGIGGYNVYEALSSDGSGSGSGSGAGQVSANKASGPPSGEEIKNTARDFLAAWAKGDTDAAAALTDNAEGSRSALTGFTEQAKVAKVALEPGEPNGDKVPFKVTAQIEADHGKTRSTWTYDSALRIKRGATTGKALVDWQASVVHPKLKRGQSLQTGSGGAPPVQAVDRHGTPLDAKDYPSLSAVLPALREAYGEKAGGVQGIEVRVKDESGELGETLHTLVKGKEGKLRTTLDEKAQRAAEAAVKEYGESSVVAVQPSSGDILAVANNRKDAYNAAFQGQLAPGSTMKVVSAALLMDKGLVSGDKVVECPKFANAGGRAFHNLNNFATQGETFAQGFAHSCNTAFVGFADQLGGGALTAEARDVFGLGLDWKVGVATHDGRVPESEGAETGAALIGQGRIQVSPLNMASVAATASTGRFAQPVLVSRELDDRPVARAARTLSPSVTAQLKAMMRRTAVSGTASKVMAGLGGDTGAKTGSAEADNQGNSDSWFLGYRNDAAAAAVVQQGGHGGDAAGPIVRKVLAAGG